MDFTLIDDIINAIQNIPDAKAALESIIHSANKKLPSKIWANFNSLTIQTDTAGAEKWIQSNINQYPGTKGIYLGLDTLNMDNGKGTNIEIGLSAECDPRIFSTDWSYECDYYGKGHLINGLFLMSDSFSQSEKWSYEERSTAKYVIFLGYSGIILREALQKIDIENDFLSVWGFHDGDMFFLINKRGNTRTCIANIDI
jgi:hypothetical protein